jgi:7,8-dihydropterin-6-yl-methyl-4-(beta-D-ribofuranosyl)aminobenzene 5'-phosphate synthase
MADSLIELDSLEVVMVIDNEVDPMSPYPNPQFSSVSNRFIHVALNSPHIPQNRGNGTKEMKMSQLCCGAHGLSLMIVSSVFL